ncbi:MAG: hypothetical protein EXS05_11795 [Planctomycetaceae bacterium]|nr:hypothetical protein [Planctomycetaceae bacterium]
MKKLLTLVALLAVGAWFAGCGEDASKPPAKPNVNVAKPGLPVLDAHDHDADKDKDMEEDAGEAPADEGAETEAPGE